MHVIDGTKDANISSAKENEILVVNKSDLASCKKTPNAIYVSAKTGSGIKDLIEVIKEKISTLTKTTESTVAVNARTYSLLQDAAVELNNAINSPKENYDIFSEHVRRAADNIGKILGTITASEVMDATFSQLCLGK